MYKLKKWGPFFSILTYFQVSKSSSSSGKSGRSSRSTGNPSEQEPDVSLTATVEPTGSSTAATLQTPDPAIDNNPTDAVDTNNSGEDEIDGYVLLPTTTSLPSSSTVVTSSVPSSSQTFSGQQRSASGKFWIYTYIIILSFKFFIEECT